MGEQTKIELLSLCYSIYDYVRKFRSHLRKVVGNANVKKAPVCRESEQWAEQSFNNI